MKQKKSLKKIFITLLFLLIFSCLFLNKNILAQSSFPSGGSSFETATEIKPGQYSGAKLDWDEESGTTELFYYLNNVQSGQAIEAATKFSGNTNLDVSLYDADKVKLTDVYGGDDIDALTWLIGSPTKTGKYYLVIKNDAVELATNISLELKVSDKYDAGSSVDAGNVLTAALPITPGSYQGYFSGEQGNDENDFYSLKLKKGNLVSVKITPPSKDSINLAIYDANRTQLDENTSVNSGEITTLSFTPANDGDYYLGLSCYYGCAKIVNYQMEISGAALPTGGGLLTGTGTPAANVTPAVGPVIGGQPRDQKFIFLIVLTVIIIITVVYLILRKKPIEKNEPQMNSGSPDADKATVGYKHPCKYCDKLIPPNSKSCPFCGKNNPQGPIRCPKCNTPVEKDWKVCSNCDLPLSVKCPKCGKTTFFGDYCEHCDGRLTVVCPNCQTEQPPISDVCQKCKKTLTIEKKK